MSFKDLQNMSLTLEDAYYLASLGLCLIIREGKIKGFTV